MIEAFDLRDIARMRKKHPCGSSDWEIIRTGADVKLKCLGCGHVVMMPRQEFVKKAAKITPRDENIGQSV